MLLINNPSKVKSAEIAISKKKNKHKDSVQQHDVENSNDTKQKRSIHEFYLGREVKIVVSVNGLVAISIS